MQRLKMRFGSKLGMIHAYKQKLYAGNEIKDDINGYSNLINNLCCFETVLKYCNDDETNKSHSNGEIVARSLTIRVSHAINKNL